MQHLGTGGNAAWVKMVGTLAGVGSGDTLTYPACRLDFNGRQCNKKVQPGGDDSGLFFCSRCQQSCQPMYRYLLNLNLVDFTGGLEHVSVFGELGDTVMGMNADDAHEVGAPRLCWATGRVVSVSVMLMQPPSEPCILSHADEHRPVADALVPCF